MVIIYYWMEFFILHPDTIILSLITILSSTSILSHKILLMISHPTPNLQSLPIMDLVIVTLDLTSVFYPI